MASVSAQETIFPWLPSPFRSEKSQNGIPHFSRIIKLDAKVYVLRDACSLISVHTQPPMLAIVKFLA